MSLTTIDAKVKYGLPKEVKFCKKCVLSNQRPNSTNELSYTPETSKESTFVDENGICDACKFTEMKNTQIDWQKRDKMLQEICDRFRSKDGSHDCIVPGSGGKDSRFVSHILKYKYGMNPLTVTWPPTICTDIGRLNFQTWLNDFDNVTVKPNTNTHRFITKLAFVKLLHPFQTFIIGQRIVAPRLAIKYKIPLIFYGEPQAEYGNRIQDAINLKATMPQNFYVGKHDFDSIFMGGVSVRELIERYNIDHRDINPYLPLTKDELKSFSLEYHYFGYYKKWDPMHNYNYAKQHTGYKEGKERTEGTYSKYASLDDKIDGFHYFTTFTKFGIGRATHDAAIEIRNGQITREKGIALVKRFDGEFPKKYFKDVLEYMDISEELFWECINKSRSPHLWKKENETWALRYQVS